MRAGRFSSRPVRRRADGAAGQVYGLAVGRAAVTTASAAALRAMSAHKVPACACPDALLPVL